MGFVINNPTGIQPLSTSAMNFGSIQNNWDAIMEDFDAVAYLPFGDEYFDAMNQIMNAVGNREIAKNPRVRWFEMTRMEAPILVASTAAFAGPPVGFTVTLDASNVVTLGSTTYSWPNIGDIWRDASEGTLFQIIQKPAANQVVMIPLITGAAAPTGLMYYVGNSAGENTGAYPSKFTFDVVRTSPLQTFRNDTTSSSEALYNQLWYSQLENGVQTPYSNSRDIIYLQREHQVALVNTFFAGTPSTATGYSTTLSATNFQTTTGLEYAIRNNQSGSNGGGINTVVPTGGTPDATDFYAMEAALTSQDGSVKNYMVWASGYMQSLMEQNLFGIGQPGATNLNPLNFNVQVNKVQMEKTFWGEGAYADLMSKTFSFNNLVFNNKNFAFVRMGIFDNPTMLGVGANAAANAWKNYAFFIPLSTNGGVDDGMGNMGKYIRLAHKPGAFMNMWQTGGRAAANKTDVWQLGVHIVSEVAYKFINANKYGLFTA